MALFVTGFKTTFLYMYHIVLFIHSWIRWIILLLSVIVIIKSFIGWKQKLDYKKSDNKLSIILVSLYDVQLLLGLLLYFVLSPITRSALMDFGKAMHNPGLRFWAVEHIFVMTLAIIVAHLGRSFTKKAQERRAKFRIQGVYFLLAFILVISRIPWHDSVRLFRGITH